MRMNVSVVIPAYNEEEFIGNCLDSLSHQDVKPTEIIVVDKNSTDRTREICERFAAVRVVSEACQGIVFFRNARLAQARGDIIARCDADSVLPHNWVHDIIACFE